MLEMETSVLILVLVSSILALIVAALFAFWISKQSRGSPQMKEFSDAIHEGAMTFLNQEYRYLSLFIALMLVVLFLVYSLMEGGSWSQGGKMALTFLIGAILSALAGNMGMRIATVANSRTTQACRKDLNSGLRVAVRAGSVMGLCVVGLGLLGVFVLYELLGDVSVLFGYGFGASSIALFARVGGGIYTKGADVGADIVGKVEENIPEDDPRNPGVIADNVGDNVGDVAGMGADLFESYVEAIISAMLIGFVVLGGLDESFVSFPMVIAGLGILSSIVGVLIVRGKKPSTAMNVGTFISAGLVMVLSLLASYYMLDAFEPFYAVIIGLVAGLIIGLTTQYFTSYDFKPVKSLAEDAKTGPATVIISGMSLGMMSTVIPIVVVAIAIISSYSLMEWAFEPEFSGIYGIALAAVGMLSTLGMTLSTDCYGPVADNAAGIAEMAHVGPEVRERCENLDAVGNTTAAIGKGFAIGSAALAALALLFSYVTTCVGEGLLESYTINLLDSTVIAGLFLGALVPFLFSSLALRGVGKAAHELVEEIRRQFREIKGLREGEAKPDYSRAVEISTTGAIHSMILPGVIAVVAPILVGYALGPEALAGFLVGALASGFLLAIYMANAGGAWDNAKKYIETGELGGKGSEPHAASVIGDTVGDPLKDTAGPSLNILIKLMSVVALIFIPLF